MAPFVDARNLSLWEGKSPGEIWNEYKQAFDRRVDELFRPERSRAIISVREAPPSSEEPKERP